MGLFEEKMKRARAVVANIEDAAMQDFDKVIARGEELHRKREQATTAHLVKLDSLHASLDSFEKSINEFANGAPPLSDGAAYVMQHDQDSVDNAPDPLPKSWVPPKD